MSATTKIEWTDWTWNPIRARLTEKGRAHFGVTKKARPGHFCVHVSEGCRNCYAETRQPFFGHGAANSYRQSWLDQGYIEVYLDEKELLAPLKWKKPGYVFVCSMTDLFGEWVPQEWIDRVLAVMALTPHLTYQVLTKRAERMEGYFAERWQPALAQSVHGIDVPAEDVGEDREYQVRIACEPFLAALGLVDPDDDSLWTADGNCKAMAWTWPLPNLWLGVSVEDQAAADLRIPPLLRTPAAVRFISAEPLLGAVDLRNLRDGTFNALDGIDFEAIPSPGSSGFTRDGKMERPGRMRGLDWVIVGGESGPGARPMHPDWARKLRDQCQAAGVAFFFKQWGEWAPRLSGGQTYRNVLETGQPDVAWPDGTIAAGTSEEHGGLGMSIDRVGKQRAGRLLDGVEHDGMPG
jgi:protein gp37